MTDKILMAVRGCPTYGPWKIPTKEMFAIDMQTLLGNKATNKTIAFLPEENNGRLAAMRKMLRQNGLKTITKKGRLFFFVVSTDWFASPAEAVTNYDKCEFACLYKDFDILSNKVNPVVKGLHTKYLKTAAWYDEELKEIKANASLNKLDKTNARRAAYEKLKPTNLAYFNSKVKYLAKTYSGLTQGDYAIQA